MYVSCVLDSPSSNIKTKLSNSVLQLLSPSPSIFSNLFDPPPQQYLTAVPPFGKEEPLLLSLHDVPSLLLVYIWIVYHLPLHFFSPSHCPFPGPRETCHWGVSLPGVDEPRAPVDGLASCPPPCDCRRVNEAPGQMLRLQTVSHQGLQVSMPV